MTLRVFDWFAGIGGFRLGLERAGMIGVGACELADPPRLVYADRFGQAPEHGDIADVHPDAVRGVADVWTAGFPCQDVSPAVGTRVAAGGLDGERSGLVWELLRLAADARPDWLILENSPGLLVRRRGLGRFLRALAGSGYVGAYRVLDACAFGVPQHRRRVYIVARRAGAGGPCPGAVLLQREGGGGHAPAPCGAGTTHARTVTSRPGIRGDQDSDSFIYGDRGGWRATHPGLDPVDAGAADPYVRMPTVTECERMQGFPDGWTRAAGSDAKRRTCIGNAVVPAMVEWIGGRLMAELAAR